MNTHPKVMNATQNHSLDAEEGFAAKAVTADLARRQLHVSLGVMGVIVAAAVAVVSTVGVAPQAGAELRADLTVQQPQFVRSMTASSSGEIDRRPGG